MWGSEGIQEMSMPSAQFCCEAKSAWSKSQNETPLQVH